MAETSDPLAALEQALEAMTPGDWCAAAQPVRGIRHFTRDDNVRGRYWMRVAVAALAELRAGRAWYDKGSPQPFVDARAALDATLTEMTGTAC